MQPQTHARAFPIRHAVGLVLVAAGLVIGVVSAPTAYLPPLSLPDERLVGLTLAAPAGEVRSQAMRPDESGPPLVNPTDDQGRPVRLTPELLGTLRDAGVKRVRVKEFALDRWTGRWMFLVACAQLLLGAALVRMDRRRRLDEAQRDAQAGQADSPAQVFARIRGVIDGLLNELGDQPASRPDPAERILHRLDAVQGELVPAFVEARPLLVARMGMAGYAELMDHFAAMERQINRAWSAAADGVVEESIDCLRRAQALAREVQAVLDRAAA